MKELILTMVLLCSLCNIALASSELTSIDTEKYTISKVRTALRQGQSIIVASSYHGTVLGIGYNGEILWQNELSGFMNHDLWCEDITGNSNDEILVANADGFIYCLDADGKLLGTFKVNDVPMNAVCAIRKDGVPYIACGGYDLNLYYLTSRGELVKTIDSRSYGQEKTWGDAKARLAGKRPHSINFLRPIQVAGDKETLALHGVIHSLSGSGGLYLFEPLADKPYSRISVGNSRGIGDFRALDIDNDGIDELLFGTSGMIHSAGVLIMHPETDETHKIMAKENQTIRKKMDNFGYRVSQPELINSVGERKLMLLLGSRLILMEPDTEDGGEPEVLICRYSFNDMWRDPVTEKIILASAQSGGSCIHIINTNEPEWKHAYENLIPSGKVATIIGNTDTVRNQITAYKTPAQERDPLPVYFVSDPIPDSLVGLVDTIHENYKSPVFLKNVWLPKVENWDRSNMPNEKYRERRDRRKQYVLSSDEIVELLTAPLESHPGISYWGGHGNDPYQTSLTTQKRVIDAARGKMVVTIYPELEDRSEDFGFVLEDYFYPLAAYCRGHNARIYIRGKHTFWQSTVYQPIWERFMRGEFADAIIPSMEQTTDKSMELSFAARMGLWCSGVVDDWGARCARDNPSYDRLRQHSHQMLPNHFLRYQIYAIASGARYMNNFGVDQEYMSVLWDLIARGALYVPKREELVSLNPVHMSMLKPDEHFLDDGNDVKWTVFYDEESEKNNPMAFSRLNGTWPGASVTEWDFSRYAAGVKDRRLNFLPPYNNGLVLITPPQDGIFADNDAPRGRMIDHLHPLYRGIMKEYITDGRDYYSSDGKETYAADNYYRTIAKDIKESARLIPLTVSGNIAWVAAVSAPNHIRLTLIDNGYINPSDKTATVTFNTVTPVAITDVLTGESIAIRDQKATQFHVPCGLFRFLDVQIKEIF